MPPDPIAQLETTIASLEAQRAILGETVIEAALAPLRQQLAALRQAAQSPASQPALPTFQAERLLEEQRIEEQGKR